jgi:hypothetical protein
LYFVQNSVFNSLSFKRAFRDNRRSASSQAVAGVCSTVRVKFILGVGSKVKESRGVQINRLLPTDHLPNRDRTEIDCLPT